MANPSILAVFERMWQHIIAKVDNCVSTEVFYNHIDATQEVLDGKADLEVLNNHTSNMENPHGVTAEQIGALSITGGIMEDMLTLNGIVLTEGIDYGHDDPGAGVLGQLYFKKVT